MSLHLDQKLIRAKDVVGLIIAICTIVGMSWFFPRIMSRVEALEKDDAKYTPIIDGHSTQIAVIQATNTQILETLRRIEGRQVRRSQNENGG